MKLRSKISLIVLFVWGLLLATTYFYGDNVLKQSYHELEHKEGLKNISEVKANINRIVGEVAKMAAYWAVFDDAYQFMSDKNEEYIKGTVTIATLGQADVDLMLYYTPAGEFFYGLVADESREESIGVPPSLFPYLQPNSPLVHQPNVNSHTEGLISIPEGILIVAAHSIVKSDSTGPARGSQIVARRFTDETIKKLENITRLKLALYTMKEVTATPALNTIYSTLTKEPDGYLTKVSDDEQSLLGYLLLKDINDKPIAIVQSTAPRDIYHTGVKTLYYFNTIFFVSGLIFLILVLFLLKKLLIDRVTKVNQEILDISSENNFNKRLVENGNDEITSFEKKTNKFFDSITRYRSEQEVLINQVSSELNNVTALNKKIEETEKLFSDTINHMPSMLVMVNDQLNIFKVNVAVEKYLNKSEKELSSHQVMEFFPFLNKFHKSMQDALEHHKMKSANKFKYEVNGMEKYYDINIYPLDHHAAFGKGLVIRIIDITQTVIMEEKIRQNDKLSSIGVITAGVAAEIIKPVDYIKTAAPIINRNVSEVLNLLGKYDHVTALPQQDQTNALQTLNKMNAWDDIDQHAKDTNNLLDEVKNASVQIDEIVKNLRQFTRIDENIVKQYSVNDGIESTINLLKYKCLDRINIVRQFKEPYMLYCIPGRFNQVLMNIISNAIDAIQNKGEIVIATTLVDGMIQVKIKDNGVGIPEDIRNKIFHPFFSTKSGAGRTGLGLSIAYSIIQEMCGTIHFKSQEGLGTEFIISVPDQQEQRGT